MLGGCGSDGRAARRRLAADSDESAAHLDAGQHDVALVVLHGQIVHRSPAVALTLFKASRGFRDDLLVVADRQLVGLLVKGHHVSAFLDDRVTDFDVFVKGHVLRLPSGERDGAEQGAEYEGNCETVQTLFHLYQPFVAHLGDGCFRVQTSRGNALSSASMNVAAGERFAECDEARMAGMNS